jgi:hypothetical protein
MTAKRFREDNMDFIKLYKKIVDLDQGRKILIESEKPVEECGMMGMGSMGSMNEHPTTISVNMNASGADGIRELLNILQGRDDDLPCGTKGPDVGPAGVLIGMSSSDDDMSLDMDDMPSKRPMLGMDPEMDEEYANTSQPKISGVDAVTSTGDDMFSKGREAPKVNGGGNPLAENLRGKLTKLYNEIKTR